MTLTEAQTQFNALADRLSAAKAAQKAALAALGRTPTDVWDTYPDELRAVTGGTGNYQESKTVIADPAGMTILPDEGYSGMLKAIIAAEPNFQPWNMVDGIEAWGITGTAKPAVSTAPPTNLPVDKDDADTAYEEQTGAAPAETDYFVCADNNGNITYWYLSESFEITSYNPINTDFAAKGAVRLAYHTTGENAGQWTFDDFTNEASAGENYLKNIRYCTREKLYYNDVEIWPNSPTMWSYNGTVLPKLPEWDRKTYPYCVICKRGKLIPGYNFWAFSEKPILYWFDSDTVSMKGSASGTPYVHCSIPLDGTSWSSLGSSTLLDSASANGPFWSNYDAYIENTLYLAASNPIPVYE